MIQAIKKHAKKPLDVHLMIQYPDQYIEALENVQKEYLPKGKKRKIKKIRFV